MQHCWGAALGQARLLVVKVNQLAEALFYGIVSQLDGTADVRAAAGSPSARLKHLKLVRNCVEMPFGH